MNLSVDRVIKNWKESVNIKFKKENFVDNKISFGRRFSKQSVDKNLWKKAFAKFNLFPKLHEPRLGTVLMNHYEEGACTHIHKDDAPEGYVHVRANVMLKKPKKGGDIIVDGRTIKVNENDLWLILASLENHGSTPIKYGERLIYSFGAVVKNKELEKIIKMKK